MTFIARPHIDTLAVEKAGYEIPAGKRKCPTSKQQCPVRPNLMENSMYERETKTWHETYKVAEIPLSTGAQGNQAGTPETETTSRTGAMAVETAKAGNKTDVAQATVQPVCLLSRYRRPATKTAERTDA